MINNLNKVMIIKRFEMMNESNLEIFDFFYDDNTQQLLTKDLIGDYFSIIEGDYKLEMELSIIKSNNDGGIYVNEVKENHAYAGEVVWFVKIQPKSFDRDYYIDHGDSITELLEVDNFKKLTDCFKDLNSTITKIKTHNHSALIGFDGTSINCIIRNNENKEKSHI